MTDQDAEQAAGVRLEKTDEYTRHRDAMKAHGFAVVHGFKADAMRDELRAEVVRLAEELEHTEQRAEDAEARAEELRRERDRLRHRELARHGDWCEGCRRYATIETQIRRGWVTDGEGVHLCPFCQDDAATTVALTETKLGVTSCACCGAVMDIEYPDAGGSE